MSMPVIHWRESWRADPAGRAVINNHYTRQSPESKQFVPPGRCVVLTIHETDQREVALWITSWPFADYVKHAWPGAWVCSAFRNQRPDLHLSSSLIIEALAGTRWYWEPPAEGMITFVDPTKIIRKRDPGRCFIKAGFHVAGMHYRCPKHPEVSPPRSVREAARRAGSGRCAVCNALLAPACTCTPGPTQTADGKPALHMPPWMMPAPMMPLGAMGRLL